LIIFRYYATYNQEVEFMEQIIHTPQDLTYLSWSKIRNSSGTAGSFLKAQEGIPSDRIYYKLSGR
jgi:hypothetical protein